MFVLAEESSIANIFLAELRDKQIQSDKLRFRRNMERIGEILAYEISKTLEYNLIQVDTPLAQTEGKSLKDPLVLCTILRAGLPFHQGFLNVFDHAENAFIASYRNVLDEEGTFEIKTEYLSSPSIENKILILSDPMLATGQSLVLAWQAITKQYGQPLQTHIASIIASRRGIDTVREKIPQASLWTGAIDDDLNSRSYIVPGIGDVGDLAYGIKI
jgi:uracil phosphoribosyltransferase